MKNLVSVETTDRGEVRDEVRRASTRASTAKEEDGRYLVGKQDSDKVRLVFRMMTVSALWLIPV